MMGLAMAYNEKLAGRIRRLLAMREGVTERKMFGGLAFMLSGNMACGIVGDDLMVRIGPEGYEAALLLPGTRPMDFTGRPMKGMLFVGHSGYHSDESLEGWLDRALEYANSLPPKGLKRAQGVVHIRSKYSL